MRWANSRSTAPQTTPASRIRVNLSASWGAVEEQILSGDRLVSSYEEFTGSKFPEAIKDKFIPMVNMMRDAYRGVERVGVCTLAQYDRSGEEYCC
jgi:hypothetical protein